MRRNKWRIDDQRIYSDAQMEDVRRVNEYLTIPADHCIIPGPEIQGYAGKGTLSHSIIWAIGHSCMTIPGRHLTPLEIA